MVARYEKRIDELQNQVKSLTEQVKTLTDQVQKLTPRNSSLPPSTEHPHAKPKRKAADRQEAKAGRTEGAQAASPRTDPQWKIARPSLPAKPATADAAAANFSPIPRRRNGIRCGTCLQIKPIVDEYQLFRGHCPCCGITTLARLPEGVPSGQCGPRLAAFTGLLMGHFRQSKRRASSFLGDLLNIPCSPAWTVKIQKLVSDAVAAPYEQLRQQLTDQKQLFVDESPTKEKNKKAWLWVAVAPMFAVFGIFANRKRESLV